MLGFLKKLQEDNSFSYDQALIVNIMLDTMKGLGDTDDRKTIESLEEQITKSLPVESGVDGHEYGEGECTIYIYGPNVDALWAAAEPILKKSPFNHIDVTLQYGKPDDPNTKEKKFSL